MSDTCSEQRCGAAATWWHTEEVGGVHIQFGLCNTHHEEVEDREPQMKPIHEIYSPLDVSDFWHYGLKDEAQFVARTLRAADELGGL